MKRMILAAGVLAMAAALVPVSASAATTVAQAPVTSNAVVAPEFTETYFYIYNIAPGSSKTEPLDWTADVYGKQHVEVVFQRFTSSSTINANIYLVDANTNVAVRGPVKYTGLNRDHVFYDVNPGEYRVRIVNNGTATITAAEGYVRVDPSI